MENNPPQLLRAVVPSVEVLIAPVQGAELDTHILLGEDVEFLKHVENSNYYRVRALLDGKEGYVQSNSFEPAVGRPTHRVTVPRAVVFRHPNFKGERKTQLTMNALVTITDVHVDDSGLYVQISGLLGNEHGWMHPAQLAPIDDFNADLITTARSFVGSGSYVWGSRDANIGMDCSALIQAALIRCGHESPRDSKPMSKRLGVLVREGPDIHDLRPGQFIFWEKHVAMMVSETHCVHATNMNPYHCILVQPLKQVMAEKLYKKEGSITKIRELFPK